VKLKDLINKSVYGTIGYIASKSDIDLLEQYIVYNLPVLKEYKQIIVATNFGENLQAENEAIWRKYFPNCVVLDSKVNRGHNHGYVDLDNIIFEYCKENNIEWLCKSANDIIVQGSILDKEIGDADFYYLEGIGVGGLELYNYGGFGLDNYDYERIKREYFYPQTNFYFINVDKVDRLYDMKYMDETFEYVQAIENYNGRIWEYIKGWSCEDFLKQCVERNGLVKEHLIPEEKYDILLNVVKTHDIHDCSHKNIMIEGICHFPYPEQTVIII
jgi:hypothetical protein